MTFKVATSIKYGNYKHLQTATNNVIKLINSHWSRLKENIDFNEDVCFLIRPIKGTTRGIAFNKSNRIEIDPRYHSLEILETIAHELVHSEQYKQNRLVFDATNRLWVWSNTSYRTATSFRQYYNFPWEVEARERATAYINKYCPV